MLSSFTLQMPVKVAISATVIATAAFSRDDLEGASEAASTGLMSMPAMLRDRRTVASAPLVLRLAEHRADAAHLEHHPLQHFVLGTVRLRHEFPGLGREVDQDRTGFEHRDRLAVRTFRVRDGGNLVVRADLQEIGLELVARPDV